MAQLERPHRHVDTSKTPASPTVEQLLRGESSKASPTNSPSSSSPLSPFFQRLKHHDPEEDHGNNQKKSVLTKVKEKAKKLRHSLSKKRHEDGNVTSPSCGVGLEDDGEGEDDAEYLGAPMYESELAPQGYKENARQHPRAIPVITEKRLLSSTDKQGVEQDQENPPSRAISKRTTQAATITLPGPNKTMTSTIAEKLTPAYAEGSDAARSISSKIQGLAVSKPADRSVSSKIQGLTVSKPAEHHISPSFSAPRRTSLSPAAPLTPPAKTPSQTSSSAPRTSSSAPATPQTSSSSSAPLSRKNASPVEQIWDKGVSVKEYLMNKLEPGEDEKALSQVISEAMSPRRTPGDAGVMEKVREAVNSLLRNEEPSKYADTTPATRASSQIPVSASATQASSQIPVSANATKASSHQIPVSANATQASSQIPVSTNAQEVGQEKNHGRTLQAN